MRAAILLVLLASLPAPADPPRPDDYARARAADEMGLRFNAFFHYAAVLQEGRTSPHFLEAASGAVAAAEDLGDETIAPSVFDRIYGDDFSAMPPERLARIHSWLALLGYRAGRYEDAARFAARVPADSSAFPQAQYVAGLLQQRADPEKAVATFRALAAMPRAGSGLRELATLALGRTLYGLRRYPEASAAYATLPRFSRHWDEALFEGAYADLRNGDPGGALGKLHSLHSPHLRDEFVPESLSLTAILFQQRCLYPRVRAALEQFDGEYLPMRDQAKQVLQGNPPVEEFWRMLSPSDARLPAAMKQHLSKNERVASMVTYLG
ncbi:MAG: hypothetical protein ACXWLR_10940, partial [Myxococcales bacterium]